MTSAAFAELCPGCLTNKGTASTCPHCGYDESLKRGPLVLPHRALLHQGQYLIGKVLGKPGGFGITYLALDTRLETRVAIKEYLPRDLAGRDGGHATISAHSAEDGEFFRYGLTQFLQEARTLAKFDHANIVRVRNFFEENGTGYLVMDYYDGITLADYLAQQPQGKLPEKTAIGILMPILDGLREVHAKNFLHRDIKPQNIYLTTGNRPILLDFGAARQAMGERSRSISVVLSEGYAPYEQYHRRGEQGPWTDIYACAAVLYHAVAGEAPPPATERVHKDELDIAALGVSASLAEALRLGLAVDHNKRPQRMTEFQALLLGSGAAEGVQKPKKDELFATTKIKMSYPVEPTFNQLTLPDLQEVVQHPHSPTQSKGRPGLKDWWAPVLAVFIIIAIAMSSSAEKKTEPTADAPVLVESEAEMQPGNVFKDCPECPEMVVIPAGNFEMGLSNPGRAEPVHTVSITSFAIGKFEITRGQFSAFVSGTGYKGGNECVTYNKSNKGEKRSGFNWQNPGFPQNDNHPVVCTSWGDAKAYVAWLSSKTGKSYRLVSEAEWEYAARANTTTERYWGESPNQACSYANVRDSTMKSQMPAKKEAFGCADGVAYTASIGSFKPNAFGLYDMIGNVWEWVEDCFDNNDDYYGALSNGSAWSTEQCSGKRIFRGGSWYSAADYTNAANREPESPDYRDSDMGFRIARMTAKVPVTVGGGIAEATALITRARELEMAGKAIEADRFYKESSGMMRRMDVSALRKAAEQGNACAQQYLGYMYENGEKVAKDGLEATRWYRKAADQGDVAAQTALGIMYLKVRDDAEAVRWLRKAADQEYTAAQYGIGMMFATGRGVDKDDAEAVRWFRKAAEKGHPDARTELQKRDSQHEATTHPVKQVDLAQSMKSYGGVAILYAFSVRVIDECSARYPSLSGLARNTKDAYMVRNMDLFEQTTKRINLLVENRHDEKEKIASKKVLLAMKSLIDQKVLEEIQSAIGSTQACEAALVKIGRKDVDLKVMAADELAMINE